MVRSHRRPWWYHQHLCNMFLLLYENVIGQQYPIFAILSFCYHAESFWTSKMIKSIPEIYANRCEIIFCESIFSELHQYRRFSHSRTANQNQFYQMIWLFNHFLLKNFICRRDILLLTFWGEIYHSDNWQFNDYQCKIWWLNWG